MAMTTLQRQKRLALIALALVALWFVMLLATGGVTLTPVSLISALAIPVAVALLAWGLLGAP